MSSALLPIGIDEMPPTADELPYDDGEPLESNRHQLQGVLLRETLDRALRARGRGDYFIAVNMALHFSVPRARKGDFRAPDLFLVLGTEHRDRKSWVLWEEDGKAPDVIIELLSDRTESVDRGEKMRIYGAMLRVPEYYLYDPLTGALEGYKLDLDSGHYERMQPDDRGRLSSSQLGLLLGLHDCTYRDFGGLWLRWMTPDGTIVPTDEEVATAAEKQRDEAAKQRDEAAKQRDEAAKQRDEAAKQRDEVEKQRDELLRKLATYEQQYGPLKPA